MPSAPNDPWNAKPQWPWILGGAIVIVGLFIAIALFASRNGKIRTVYVTGGGATASRSAGPSPSETPSAAPVADGTGVSGEDLKAQANLDEAATSAKAIQTATGSMMRANSLGLAPTLPSFTFKPPTTDSTGPDDLSLWVNTTTWAAAALSKSGTCWWITFDNAGGATTYGSGTDCSGLAATAASGSAWPVPSPSPTPSPTP